MIEHSISNHDAPKDSSVNLTCPKCQKQGFKDESSLVQHNDQDHSQPTVKVVSVQEAQIEALPQVEHLSHKDKHLHRIQDHQGNLKNKALPRAGDRVLAMWSSTPWQYFHAVIRRFIPSKLQFEIDWDDPDPTGRIVDYFNLAMDKSPDANEISIGSIVLFPQGEYVGGPLGGTYGGVRWHQGRITKIHNYNGERMFDGCHTKGEADEKWITYKGYSYAFSGLRLEDLRIGPNVFDILDDNDCANEVTDEDIDIYFSYAVNDSPQAIKNQEIAHVPQKYKPVLDRLCDPRDIANHLTKIGLKIGIRKATSGEDLKRTAGMMKQAKVFVACISDEYVANDECRMEFQYAKTTLGTPVVPLVVGDGSFDWTMSVVGMLIAGELYIHFKDKTVENVKINELISALKAHCEKLTDVTDSCEDGSPVEGTADIFLSYNWKNSFLAKEAKQVDDISGNQFTDPRLVKKELEKAGFKVWLDIERLRSAKANAGMYEQLTSALKDAKIVLACVSSEYANSSNCSMEFQFALKSLQKPLVPLIVGQGDDWKASVIGGLVASSNNQPINLQDVNSHESLAGRLNVMFDRLRTIMDLNAKSPFQLKKGMRRAPKVGDHVISHHQECSYYMATVAMFDSEKLEYTVDWDDGDLSGRVQPYDQVALDVVPDPDDVGIGSIVFFPQGTYHGSEGSNSGGQRYHEGLVTSCKVQGDSKLVSGHHTKGEDDGKWVSYQGYSYAFHGRSLNDIRIAPSAMDALLASKL